MKWHLFLLFLLAACQGREEAMSPEDASIKTAPDPVVDSPRVNVTHTDTSILFLADSVLITSHHSPNYPRRDSVTGKQLPRFEIIENGKINYDVVVEKKKLKQSDVKKLSSILFRPATKREIVTACFQPRHAVFVFKHGKISSLDICFDCGGAACTNDFHNDLIFDNNKYAALQMFFKKQGFKYEL